MRFLQGFPGSSTAAASDDNAKGGSPAPTIVRILPIFLGLLVVYWYCTKKQQQQQQLTASEITAQREREQYLGISQRQVLAQQKEEEESGKNASDIESKLIIKTVLVAPQPCIEQPENDAPLSSLSSSSWWSKNYTAIMTMTPERKTESARFEKKSSSFRNIVYSPFTSPASPRSKSVPQLECYLVDDDDLEAGATVDGSSSSDDDETQEESHAAPSVIMEDEEQHEDASLLHAADTAVHEFNKNTATTPASYDCLSIASPPHRTYDIPPANECCGICLLEYEVGDEVAFSPNDDCVHAYHKECIVGWLLRKNNDCPFCRLDYLYDTADNVEVEA